MNKAPFLSIVTPTYNEEDTIAFCIQRVAEVMAEKSPGVEYEHIIIDNASTDKTLRVVSDLLNSYPGVKLARNDKNIGGVRNIYRGLSLAKGEWIVPMLPADLQDPVEVIPEFLSGISSHTNVIFGIRSNRQESLIMRSFRTLYYKAIQNFSATDFPLHAGEFCLIHSSIAEAILNLQDENPYVRGLIAQAAVNPKFVTYEWGRRKGGVSKASPLVLADVAASGLVSTSTIPARLALFMGFAISGCSLLIAATQVILVLIGFSSTMAGIPTIIVSIFFFGGLQLFFIGIIGEYVLSLHKQIKKAPEVRTRLISGFPDER